jgi:hypothetical protein
MDDEQRRKHAPWRNNRHSQPRTYDQEADWADTLDWKTNTYAFYRLFEAVCAAIDLDYREYYGIRVDQLAGRDELYAVARSAASFYQEHEDKYSALGIYWYLETALSYALRDRARETRIKRRAAAETLDYETHAA